LELARKDVDAAVEALRQLEPVAQARVCLEVHPERRHQLLELIEAPGEVVPLLPEVELVRTLRGGGLEDTHWLLEHASATQRVACIDLCCWRDGVFDPERFRDWIDALIEAGSEALLAALTDLDLELWVLALRDLAHLSLAPSEFAESEDGFLYFTADTAADAERVRQILRVCLSECPSEYLRLVAAVFNEGVFDAEEHALCWRTGRMSDLGFPERNDAMRVYRPLRLDLASVGELRDANALSSENRQAKMREPNPRQSDARQSDARQSNTRESKSRAATTRAESVQPAVELLAVSSTLLGDAVARLPLELADEVQAAILAVGNTLAVADELDLGSADTGVECLGRALRGIELGLRAACGHLGCEPNVLLAETRPLDLFRIGYTLDPSLGRAAVPEAVDREDAAEADAFYDALLELFRTE